VIKVIYFNQEIFRDVQGTSWKLIGTEVDDLGNNFLILQLSNRLRPIKVSVYPKFVFPKTKKFHITLENIYSNCIEINAQYEKIEPEDSQKLSPMYSRMHKS
jgi:hypothetical protein